MAADDKSPSVGLGYAARIREGEEKRDADCTPAIPT
jgi:hypothetical protein